MQDRAISRSVSDNILVTNTVIRNTYILLSATLMFSAVTALIGMAINFPNLGFIGILPMFGLLALVTTLRNSIWGVAAVFAFTGYMGLTLGPILNFYINAYANGSQLIATSFGLTSIIFLSLSGYALTTKTNFNYLAGFLIAGFTCAILLSVMNIFIGLAAIHLIVSGSIVLLSCGYILFDTSQIINGGQRNYIMATLALYINIFNLFINLLHLLAAFAGRRD